MTFVVTCSETTKSYIPSEAAFDYDSYESQVSMYERGKAEKAAEAFVKLLTDMKEAQ